MKILLKSYTYRQTDRQDLYEDSSPKIIFRYNRSDTLTFPTSKSSSYCLGQQRRHASDETGLQSLSRDEFSTARDGEDHDVFKDDFDDRRPSFDELQSEDNDRRPSVVKYQLEDQDHPDVRSIQESVAHMKF